MTDTNSTISDEKQLEKLASQSDIVTTDETLPATTATEIETYELQRQQPQQHPAAPAEEESLTVKAKETGQSIADLVSLALQKVRTAADRTMDGLSAKEINPSVISERKDSQDISRLGKKITGLVTTFEDTMTIIRKNDYEEQAILLNGYRKLLEEQINVIDSRIHLAKRLKAD